MSDKIVIQLNGEERQVAASTLAALVSELGLEQRMIAIERNLEVVPKSQYASTPLQSHDRIELVHMIGGG
ncbi:sulfur carrier protein ThiS [Mariprofundus erugo]|uniref:Sulfur carrier protein ThiS n=1 Tax=Mariprofundus erugo TaxID=2528639 RepID=A0A5R9GS81_9PROT|nr:sulfur carrier protein ThiS [Mariprofundus erugo]TLS67809.1 sulfur carrier protein ThiS [Mariprofundus erugo]TLS75931.1 sulfur carrier protein ThiS [Mariprofundus erugo]